MAQSQVKAGHAPRQLNWTRIALTAFGTLLAMGALGWDEVVLAAPIILLVETLGFGAGLGIFISIWALIGYSMLLFVDFALPKLKPLWESAIERAKDLWRRYGTPTGIIAALLVLPGAAASFLLYPLHTIVAVGAVFFVGLMEAFRQFFEDRIRNIDPRQGKRMRWVGAMAAMVILGPVFAWTLLKWLEFSRRTVYVLTIPAAVIFGCIWVPYYSEAVWGQVLSRIF